MSTLTMSTGALLRPTLFERMLLRASSAADRYVEARILRREVGAARVRARAGRADARRTAQALGGLGVLPR